MSQESTTKETVAILGAGNIGKIVAANLQKGNRPVLLADRDLAKTTAIAATLGSGVRPVDLETAIREADIIVLAVYFNAIKELFGRYATQLQGKVLIDPSNPIAPDDKGGFVKIIGASESAGTVLSGILPKGAKLVKAFGTLSAASLSGAAHRPSEPAVLFYASDDQTIDPAIETLIRDSGFAAQRVGGIDQSIRIEVFGDLHEYGALGKTVSLAEAKAKV